MKLLSRILGTLFIIIACLMVVLGVMSWPPGGLMFALPYILFACAVVFGMAGGLLFLVGRVPKHYLSMTNRSEEKSPARSSEQT